MQKNATLKKIKYLLWDNDGVLVDTERFYYEAGRRVLNETGITLTMAQFSEISLCQGQSIFDVAAAQGVSAAQCGVLRRKRDALYSEYLQNEDILIPGVEAVVAKCASRFQMCIVSSSMKNNFFEIHARTGNLLSWFAFQLLHGDYPRSKPHPDPWLTAMRRFSATPEECLVIEDSPRGIQAAKAAEMPVVAVESRFFREKDLRPHLAATDFCISDIRSGLLEVLGIDDC